MTTSTAALCSHNSSRLLVSLCFVYLEKSGHELQNGLCVALGLSSSGLCTPTVLVTSDRLTHFHPHRKKKKKTYYSLIESQMAKKEMCLPTPPSPSYFRHQGETSTTLTYEAQSLHFFGFSAYYDSSLQRATMSGSSRTPALDICFQSV